MGARPYDQALGRFYAVDPIEGGALNLYDYAGQDPLNFYDLEGTLRFRCLSFGIFGSNCGKGNWSNRRYWSYYTWKYGCLSWGTARVFRWVRGRLLKYVDVICVSYGWYRARRWY
jgi:hypothetical protein